MSFDAIAPHYRWLERITAGPLLQCCRTRFLHEIRDARNILLLGEGRGRFLIELLQQNPEAQITCVDASARMLEFSRAELEDPPLPNRPRPSAAACSLVAEDGKPPGPAARNSGISRAGVCTTKQFMAPPMNQVQFIHANILSERLPTGSNPFDAVASHFFLDCFRPDQLAQLCSKVAECTAPGASWLSSDFCLPERGWRRLRASWILWVLYRFFRLATRLPATRLTPPDESLRRAGFRLKDRRHFNHGLLHSDVWVKGDLRDRFT